VVGAYNEDSGSPGVNGSQNDDSALNAGAAYVFTRSGTTWSQQGYFKASNTADGDNFGWAVAVAGNTVVVGAYAEDSNAIGVNGNQADNSASRAGATYVFSDVSSPGSAPEIAVAQLAGNNLVDGGSQDFGNVPAGGNASLTFTITNTGDADLTGLGVSIDGADAALFTVTASPSAPVGGPNGSTTFTVRFAPVSGGSKIATLHIASNDADENPFDLHLSGTSAVTAPTITLAGITSGAGTFRFTFPNPDNVAWTVLATSDISQPMANWTVLGAATSVGGGVYQFTDTTATGVPIRYYRLSNP
jgi:hypothetical protein